MLSFLKLTVLFFLFFCSYALFDMDGNQVPQELVTNVGVTFEHILDEVYLLPILLVSKFLKYFGCCVSIFFTLVLT